MIDGLYYRFSAIAVYVRVAEKLRPLAEVLREENPVTKLRLCAEVFSACADGGARSTGEWISRLIERDENAFSRAAARGRSIPSALKTQVERELDTFRLLSRISSDVFGTSETAAYLPPFEYGGFNVTYDKLYDFYFKGGCGILACGSAFEYGGDGFKQIAPPPVSLSDLKNYAEEKAELVKNTENFTNGMPAFHTLLCGDYGTGKTTAVRAVASSFWEKLKLIELDVKRIDLLPELLRKLSGFKQKFAVFIDGIESVGADGAAVLESALDVPIDNALIYCTADRIGAVDRESTDERNSSAPSGNVFDRFGLVITYISPRKDEFIDIFKQIVVSRGLRWRDEYASVAEIAALKKGGRTPRTAKQIADLIESTYAELR